MRGRRLLARHTTLLFLAILWTTGVFAPRAIAADSGPSNAAVTYRIVGEYRNETFDDRALRGSERFELLVHPNGSRTVSISTDLAARGAIFMVVLRVAADFRPLEAFANYWNGGALKGSGHFVIDGNTLLARSTGPAGINERTTEVPARFSIGAHPVSADGWHTASHDKAGESAQRVQLYSIEAGSDPTKPVLGTLVPLEVEYLGEEIVDVPAGRFTTQRYRLAGMNDLWVTGEDRIVVKSEIPVRKLRYVLTSLSADPKMKFDRERQAAVPK